MNLYIDNALSLSILIDADRRRTVSLVIAKVIFPIGELYVKYRKYNFNLRKLGILSLKIYDRAAFNN